MLSQSETGLDATDYTFLQSAYEDPTATLTLERWNLVWSRHDTDAHSTTTYWDAVALSDRLLRVRLVPDDNEIYVDTLLSEDSGDLSWSTAGAISQTLDEVPPSIAVSGTDVHIFFYDGTAIKYIASADSGGSFGAAVTVVTVSDVKLLAAPILLRVHYITESSDYNAVLNCYEYDGSWAAAGSAAEWPFEVRWLDAEEWDSEYDIVHMETDLPPVMGARAIGTEVVIDVDRRCGVVQRYWRNNRYSTWHEVEIEEVETGEYQTRCRPMLSQNGGYVFCTIYRTDESAGTTYSQRFISRSHNGQYWGFWHPVWSLPVPEDNGDTRDTSGKLLVMATKYVYLVDSKYTYRAVITRMAGTPHSSIQQDITPWTTEMNSQVSQMRQTTLLIGNPEDEHSGAVIDEDACLLLKQEWGYRDSAQAWEAVECQTSLEDITLKQRNLAGPIDQYQLESLDFLGRFDMIQAEHAFEWDANVCRLDEYTDATGTGYGGTKHTAAIRGSFKTPADMHLECATVNHECLGLCTFNTRVFNGQFRIKFRVGFDDKEEYAGIAFHIYDKDNLHLATYHPDTDRVHLIERQSGTDTEHTASTTMGWTYDTWYWLMVRCEGNQVWVYTSTNGVTYSSCLTYTFTGLQGAAAGSVPRAEGAFGPIGYMYSPDPSYDPFEPDPYDPPVWPLPPTFGVVWNKDNIYRSPTFEWDRPGWADITGIISGCDIRCVTREASTGALWATCGNNIYSMASGQIGSNWELKHTFSQTGAMYLGDIATDGNNIAAIGYRSDAVAQIYGLYLVVSSNGGGTWNERPWPWNDHTSAECTKPGQYLGISGSTVWVAGTAHYHAGTCPEHCITRTTDLGINWDARVCITTGVWNSWPPNLQRDPVTGKIYINHGTRFFRCNADLTGLTEISGYQRNPPCFYNGTTLQESVNLKDRFQPSANLGKVQVFDLGKVATARGGATNSFVFFTYAWFATAFDKTGNLRTRISTWPADAGGMYSKSMGCIIWERA